MSLFFESKEVNSLQFERFVSFIKFLVGADSNLETCCNGTVPIPTRYLLWTTFQNLFWTTVEIRNPEYRSLSFSKMLQGRYPGVCISLFSFAVLICNFLTVIIFCWNWLLFLVYLGRDRLSIASYPWPLWPAQESGTHKNTHTHNWPPYVYIILVNFEKHLFLIVVTITHSFFVMCCRSYRALRIMAGSLPDLSGPQPIFCLVLLQPPEAWPGRCPASSSNRAGGTGTVAHKNLAQTLDFEPIICEIVDYHISVFFLTGKLPVRYLGLLHGGYVRGLVLRP